LNKQHIDAQTPPPVDAGGRAPSSASVRGFSAEVFGTLAARVLMAFNSVGIGVVVARLLGAEQLGVYAPLSVTVALAVQIGSMGLASANTYFVAQDRRRLRRAASISFAFALAAGGALALALTALSASDANPFGDVPPALFAVAALSIPFQLTTLLGLNLFLAVGRVARFNLIDVAGQTLLLFNAVVALVLLRGGLLTLISLNTLAAVVLSLVVGWLVWRLIDEEEQHPAHRANGETDGEPLFRPMMRYGLKVHAQTVAALLLFRVDLLVVKYFRGAVEAGVYSVAAQVALMLMLLPGVISTLLFPRVAAVGDPRGALACRVTRHTAFIMLLLCAAAVPAVYALPLLYGAPFADAVVQSLILLPGVLLVSVGGVLAQHFSGTGLPPALPLFWTAALVLNAAVNLAVVPRYGARGAAVSSAASYALVWALIALYFRARTGNSLRAAFVLSGAELRELVSLRRLARFS